MSDEPGPSATPSPEADGARQAKTELRRRFRQQRAARSAQDRSDHAERLRAAALAHPQVTVARRVALYVGVGDEPQTLALVEALHERGVTVLLPVVLPDLDLDWAPFAGAGGLAATRHGLLEPTAARLGPAAVATVDVVLTPGLAVDRAGRRLGQGGGCYDRALARVPASVPVVAVVFDDELVDDDLPEEPHDRRVDAVLTG